jgi:hypothetical protein
LEEAETVEDFFKGVGTTLDLLKRITSLQESKYAADLKARVSDAYLTGL